MLNRYKERNILMAMMAALLSLVMIACDNSDSDDDEKNDVMDSESETGGSDDTANDTDSGEMPKDSSSDESSTDSSSENDAETAYIRVLHLSPDAPAVDVYAGDAKAVSSLKYPEGTAYLELPQGSYTFEVAPEMTSAQSSVLTFPDVSLEAGNYYTAVAYDAVAQISGLALADDMSDVGEGMIRVRAVHAASGVGEVDIWSLPDNGDPVKLYDNVPLGAAGDYVELPEGAHTLGFDVNEDMVPDLIFALPELASGTVATLFAVNDADGVALVAQLEGDTTAKIAAGESMVRVIHLAPEAPSVDVFANNGADAAVSELEFGKSSEFIAVPSGGYDFQVSVSGDSAADAVLTLEGNLLLPGQYYTAVAFDNGSELDSMVIVDNSTELEDGNLRVRAIHTAAGVGEVDIWNITAGAEPGILWENVPLAAAGNYYDLPAAAYSIGFDVDDNAEPDVSFQLPELPAGTVANVFAVNDTAVKLIAQFWDGTTAEILAQ